MEVGIIYFMEWLKENSLWKVGWRKYAHSLQGLGPWVKFGGIWKDQSSTPRAPTIPGSVSLKIPSLDKKSSMESKDEAVATRGIYGSGVNA